ncbi:cell division protein FtsQ/DivIB [Acidiphilium sp.]|uniref:cell division protein FtsQ/DivIB n=1 Tax=Acidiphilium TaxID=522 RepID=UPI00258DAF3E|nr:cell division protein FtsQ/DivIB [Acidiphilium sp.]
MPRVKQRKATVQDRPSPRTLLLRRLRRAGRPTAVLGVVALLLIAVPLGLRGVLAVFRPVRAAAATVAADAGFRIAHIELSGVTPGSRAVVERALDVERGKAIFAVSPAAVAARVGALGLVRSAVVERVLPDTLRVEVTERRAVAIWQRPDGRFALVGAGGAVLEDRDAGAARAHDPNLRLLVGAGAPKHAQDLLDLLARFPAIDSKVVAAERIDRLRWNLILRDHTVVELPDSHPARALTVLMQAERKIRLLDRPVRRIDLRLADRLVVRPYPKGFVTDAATPSAASGNHKS